MGAAATYCFARLLVARANRAVTVFVVAFPRGFCRVHFVIPLLSIPSFTPHSHRTQEPSFNRSFRFISFIRFWGICLFHPQYLRLRYSSLQSLNLTAAHKSPNAFHYISLHTLIHSGTCLTDARSKQKLRQPCRVAVGIQHLSVSGYLCLPPSLHSQTARAF